MEVFISELFAYTYNHGVAFVGSSKEKVIEWIKENGEKWAGPEYRKTRTSYYTITKQSIDGDAMDCETFGRFTLKGEEKK